MKSLILDCSCGMSVYVCDEDKFFSKIDLDQKKHTDELLVAVDNLLKESQMKINEIENICVCVGPGSFTGIRVAISIAKGLCVGTKSKVFVLSNFDIFDVNDEKNICILEGFSNFVYICVTEGENKESKCISIDELKDLIVNKYNNFKIYVLNEKTQNLLKKYEILSNIAQNNIISAFNDKIMKNEFIDLNQINPIYLRASQAEIERNNKLKN